MDDINVEDKFCSRPINGPEPQQMTAEEEERRLEVRQTLAKVYDLLLQWAAEAQVEEIDQSKYRLPWTYDKIEHTWICDTPPNRGECAVSPNRHALGVAGLY